MQTVCSTYRGARRGDLAAHNARKTLRGRGCASDPAGKAYSALQGPSQLQPPPQAPHPALGPLSLPLLSPTPKLVLTPPGLDLASVTPEFPAWFRLATPLIGIINVIALVGLQQLINYN